jgi:hypothetical protein
MSDGRLTDTEVGTDGKTLLTVELPKAEPIIGPNQAIESSRRLDNHLAQAIRDTRASLPTSLGSVLARMQEKTAHHGMVAADWASRLDKLDQREPAAFAAGEAIISKRETDMAEMEANIRALSNLPLGASGNSHDDGDTDDGKKNE